ncbi:MAG: xanthine phosphoribosyltransferase [Eubacteriales bacterium]|nr:xanthine phosphoribosyltransferase [Eubacteriales bacterium]
MKELEQAVLRFGKVPSDGILKVDMFLNHRLDTGLIKKMGQEIASYFKEKKPSIILTVEASGIALAITTAMALNDIPVVFAKKSSALNQGLNRYMADVHSFTKNIDYKMSVEKAYLPKGSSVLIVDDFLANGEAVKGMLKLIDLADCNCVGVAVAIEKGFQPGGDYLRQNGIDLLSLCRVKSLENNKVELYSQD